MIIRVAVFAGLLSLAARPESREEKEREELQLAAEMYHVQAQPGYDVLLY
jgi:hypothetical protein